MNKEDVKAAIVQVVTDIQGCKAKELLANEIVTRAFIKYKQDAGPTPLAAIIDELIRDRLLVAIDYTINRSSNNTFLVPANTKINVMNVSVTIT